MSLLIYGIVEAGRGGVDGTGLEHRPLRRVVEGPIAAIVSDQDEEHPEATAGAVREHPDATASAVREFERIIERLMDGYPILPAQFASMLPDEAAVRAMLRARRKDLVRRLDRVRGAVELGLRARWRGRLTAPSGERSLSIDDYLRDRLELRQSARRVASELDPLAALARSCRRALAPRPELPVLNAYLVDRTRVSEFVAMVEELDGQLDEVELVCTGPWPPYSFAEGAPV